jgi:uncharacterized protein YecT (DUF1311 family)
MSNRCLALLAVLVATAAGWPVIAADPPAGATRDCIKIADYREMVDCFAADSQAADVAATRAYEAMLAKLGPSPRRDLLRSSQEAWLAYRSAYCAFVSSAVQGAASSRRSATPALPTWREFASRSSSISSPAGKAT